MSEGFVAVRRNDKWGLLDFYNKTIIPFKFDDLDSPIDGLVKFKMTDSFGLMDIDGNELISAGFNQLKIIQNHSIIAIDKNNRAGIIDKEGIVIVPFEFIKIEYLGSNIYFLVSEDKKIWIYNSFSQKYFQTETSINYLLNGLNVDFRSFTITNVFKISEDTYVLKTNIIYLGKTLFFSFKVSDNFLIDFYNLNELGIYADDLIDSSDNFILTTKGGKRGFLRYGNDSIPTIYSNALPFSEGLAAVKEKDHWGWIDQNNDIIIPFVYEEVRSFSNNLAAVKKRGKWGFINKKGEAIIENCFFDVSDYHQFRAFIRYSDGEGNNWAIIDDTGNILVQDAHH